MKVNNLKLYLFGILGLCSGAVSVLFGFQTITGISVFFISQYNAYEQGRLGLLFLVAVTICVLSTVLAIWALRKCRQLFRH